MRRSAPPSSRCVANAWRRRCGCGERRRSVRGVEPPAARREEQRVLGAARELGPRLAEVAGDPVRGLLAERDDAVLRALAVPDVHVLLLEVDVAEVEPDGLGAAQPGRVDELDERAVAERERAVAARAPSSSRVDLARPSARPAAAARAAARAGSRARGRGPSENRSSERTAASRRAIVAGAACRPAGRGRGRPCTPASTRTSTPSSGRPRRTSRRSRRRSDAVRAAGRVGDARARRGSGRSRARASHASSSRLR